MSLSQRVLQIQNERDLLVFMYLAVPFFEQDVAPTRACDLVSNYKHGINSLSVHTKTDGEDHARPYLTGYGSSQWEAFTHLRQKVIEQTAEYEAALAKEVEAVLARASKLSEIEAQLETVLAANARPNV